MSSDNSAEGIWETGNTGDEMNEESNKAETVERHQTYFKNTQEVESVEFGNYLNAGMW